MSTRPPIIVGSMTEQRASDLLDQLGLTDCLTAPDGGEDMTVHIDDTSKPAALSIVTPAAVACRRAVDSFPGRPSLLRHQIGHRVWERLVGQSDHVASFCLVFGGTLRSGQKAKHEVATVAELTLSVADAGAGATAAALEQWAAAFDAYMLIVDIAGTAAERGLLVLTRPYDPITLPFAAIFEHALPYAGALAPSARRGPARHTVRVTADQLTFIHSRVSAHCERARFYSFD